MNFTRDQIIVAALRTSDTVFSQFQGDIHAIAFFLAAQLGHLTDLVHQADGPQTAAHFIDHMAETVNKLITSTDEVLASN